MTATKQLELFPTSIARSSDTVDPLVGNRTLTEREVERRYEEHPPIKEDDIRFLDMVAKEADVRGARHSEDKGQVYVDAFVAVIGRKPYMAEYLGIVAPFLNERLGL